MAGKISKAVRRKPKITTVSTSQLPQLYNKLLGEYVALLETESINPYELSIKARLAGYFNIQGQTKFPTSSYITNFLRTPDALAQELPRAKDMLKRFDTFDNNAVRALFRINGMNLLRLRRRSIKAQYGQRVSVLAIAGSILGLLLDLQDLIAVPIRDTIRGLNAIDVPLVIVVFIPIIIAFSIFFLVRSINRMIVDPRIGLVDAFGDILNMAMVHRNLRE